MCLEEPQFLNIKKLSEGGGRGTIKTCNVRIPYLRDFLYSKGKTFLNSTVPIGITQSQEEGLAQLQ